MADLTNIDEEIAALEKENDALADDVFRVKQEGRNLRIEMERMKEFIAEKERVKQELEKEIEKLQQPAKRARDSSYSSSSYRGSSSSYSNYYGGATGDDGIRKEVDRQ